jgi:hypothetical protein
MYTGRPVWDADAPLFDRDGNRLDPERSFTLADDRKEMAHFLRTTGYLFVRDVFSQEEIDGFLSESDELRAEAVKGDQLSWWGKNERGEEILCRITRAAAKPKLRSIPADPRMTGLAELSHENLEIRKRANAEEGVSLIYKQPAMVEGLSNLPWHRDCGMGGHALVCPVLIASVFLTESNPETGDLCMLPGSWNGTAPYVEPDHPRAPQGVRLKASPGDVSLHYGDTMHAAPAPADSGRSSYRISAVTAYAKPDRVFPKQKDGFNSVLHQSGDGQIEHLSKVTARLSKK